MIPDPTSQLDYQSRSESRERAEREHDASVRRIDALAPYWPGPTREQLRRLICLANYRIDIAELPDIEPQTTISKPVVLPSWMQRTLNRRKELAR